MVKRIIEKQIPLYESISCADCNIHTTCINDSCDESCDRCHNRCCACDADCSICPIITCENRGRN